MDTDDDDSYSNMTQPDFLHLPEALVSGHRSFSILLQTFIRSLQNQPPMLPVTLQLPLESTTTQWYEYLTRQLVETVLALVHEQNPWALKRMAPSAIQRLLTKLQGLRSALDPHVNLLDASCRILQTLPKQEWRFRPSTQSAFVSCYFLEDWSSAFLSSSISTTVKDRPSRWEEIGSPLPSCEARAVWETLIWVAQGKNPTLLPFTEWSFLSELFIKGVLHVDETEENLPPSESQLENLVLALENTSKFLVSPMMEGSKIPDSFFSKLLHKSIHYAGKYTKQYYIDRPNAVLGIEGIETVAEKWGKMNMMKLLGTVETNVKMKDWKPVNAFVTFHEFKVSGVTVELPRVVKDLVKICMDLSTLWVASVSQKRPRMKRLYTVLHSLGSGLESHGNELVQAPNPAGDLFLQAFSTVGSSNPGDVERSNHAVVVYRIASAHFSNLSLHVQTIIRDKQEDIGAVLENVWEKMMGGGGLVDDADRKIMAFSESVIFGLRLVGVVGISEDLTTVQLLSDGPKVSCRQIVDILTFTLKKYLEISNASVKLDSLSNVTKALVIVVKATLNGLKINHEALVESPGFEEVIKLMMSTTLNVFNLMSTAEVYDFSRIFTLRCLCATAVSILELNKRSLCTTTMRESHELLEFTLRMLSEAAPSRQYSVGENDTSLSTPQGRQIFKKCQKDLCGLAVRLASSQQNAEALDSFHQLLRRKVDFVSCSKDEISDSTYFQSVSRELTIGIVELLRSVEDVPSFAIEFHETIMENSLASLVRPAKKMGCVEILESEDRLYREKEKALSRKTEEGNPLLEWASTIISLESKMPNASLAVAKEVIACIPTPVPSNRTAVDEYCKRLEILYKVLFRLQKTSNGGDQMKKQLASRVLLESAFELLKLQGEAGKRFLSSLEDKSFVAARFEGVWKEYLQFHLALLVTTVHCLSFQSAVNSHDPPLHEHYFVDCFSSREYISALCTSQDLRSNIQTFFFSITAREDASCATPTVGVKESVLALAVPLVCVFYNHDAACDPSPASSIQHVFLQLALRDETCSHALARNFACHNDDDDDRRRKIPRTTLDLLSGDERSDDDDDDITTLIWKVRSELIQDSLLPSLKSKGTDEACVFRMIRLFWESSESGGRRPFSLSLLAWIVWHMYGSLCRHHGRKEDVWNEIMRLSRSILLTPVSWVLDSGVGWLLDWVKEEHDSPRLDVTSPRSRMESRLVRCYFHLVSGMSKRVMNWHNACTELPSARCIEEWNVCVRALGWLDDNENVDNDDWRMISTTTNGSRQPPWMIRGAEAFEEVFQKGGGEVVQ